VPTSIDIEIPQQQAEQLDRLLDKMGDGLPRANANAARTAIWMARQRITGVLDDLFLNFQAIESFGSGGFQTDQTLRAMLGDEPTSVSLIQQFATRERSQFGLRVSGRERPLKQLSPRQTDEGVEYYAGGWELREDAFIVESLGGHVFRREGDDRFPIEKQFGPSPAEMLSDDVRSAMGSSFTGTRTSVSNVIDRLVDVDMIRFYTDEFDDQFEFILRRGAVEDGDLGAVSNDVTTGTAAISDRMTAFSGRSGIPSIEEQFAAGILERG